MPESLFQSSDNIRDIVVRDAVVERRQVEHWTFDPEHDFTDDAWQACLVELEWLKQVVLNGLEDGRVADDGELTQYLFEAYQRYLLFPERATELAFTEEMADIVLNVAEDTVDEFYEENDTRDVRDRSELALALIALAPQAAASPLFQRYLKLLREDIVSELKAEHDPLNFDSTYYADRFNLACILFPDLREEAAPQLVEIALDLEENIQQPLSQVSDGWELEERVNKLAMLRVMAPETFEMSSYSASDWQRLRQEFELLQQRYIDDINRHQALHTPLNTLVKYAVALKIISAKAISIDEQGIHFITSEERLSEPLPLPDQRKY